MKTNPIHIILKDCIDFLKDVILFVISVISVLCIIPLSLMWSMVKNRLGSLLLSWATSLDQSTNCIGVDIWNAIFRKDKNKCFFGDMDKTISYHLGHNQVEENLSKFGLLVVWFLDKLEKDHCLKAYNNKT